jgi:septum formation protein
MKLILASSSPRRAEILRNAGFTFEVCHAQVDETRFPGEAADAYVRWIAEAKSRTVAARAQKENGGAIILGADTAVVAEGQILGKPADAEAARRMLRLLSGKTHEVLTGLSVRRIPDGPATLHVEMTRVTFLEISEGAIDAYVATGEPFDKAGAYAIQGIGGRFVAGIEGCYFNVMGLPLGRVWSALDALGWEDLRRGQRP